MIPDNRLPEIVEMSQSEIAGFLRGSNFGHLGCVQGKTPYVIPIHFAYDGPYIYFFTTEGKKTAIMDENPEVCLQSEHVTDNRNWQSVIVTGDAERLTDRSSIKKGIELVKAVNPTLTPAWSIQWMDAWVRVSQQAVYRISSRLATGRRTVSR